MRKKLALIGLLYLLIGAGSPQHLLSQVEKGTVKGKIKDPYNKPIAEVLIEVEGRQQRTRSDGEGNYSLELPGGNTYLIKFTHSTHLPAQIEIRVENGVVYDRPVKMLERETGEVEIIGERPNTSLDDDLQMMIIPLDAEELGKIPVIAPSVEALMKTLPGVASNNEFSSQYQVRGGNFDENLVYVNGIPVYRPFLARSGQQEGLGFANPVMTQDIQFSTGGFQAQYGDKLSSVLDVTYRQPKKFAASAEVGLITTNLHVEGTSGNRKKNGGKPGRFTYLLGGRRFQMSYFLNSLDTRGDYRPLFLDLQGLFTYTPKSKGDPVKYVERKNGRIDTVYVPLDKVKISAFVAATRNRFLFEPTSRVTTFGTIQQAFRLRTGFEGRELSGYTTWLGSLMLSHKPSTRLNFDYIVSAFSTTESELVNLEGGYLLGEVNTNLGSEEFNEADFDLGIGSEIRHARNYLTGNVFSAVARGWWASDNAVTHRLRFGAKWQHQIFDDQLKEYLAFDSAGYVINPQGEFGITEYVNGRQDLSSNLYTTYLQHEWKIHPKMMLISGIRLGYYDLIEAFMVSPRFQYVYNIKEEEGVTKLRLRLAAGVYQQPPFYREFRRFDGSLNLDIQPQRSIHLIAGTDYQFEAWGRPFKLFVEGYYKFLYNLIPYEIENIRLRYYPDLVADGYAYGLDMRLNGQFIKGVDSWVSVGLLKTMEDVRDDAQGYVPRPTDQRLTFSMFFQDELPINPTFKVHLQFTYGSGMRFGPPRNFEFRTFYKMPAYHRVDLGFSKLITFKTAAERGGKSGLESIWITFEIFNLLQRQNTVSYTWISDLNRNQYAVPNYLSARLLNLRAIVNIR